VPKGKISNAAVTVTAEAARVALPPKAVALGEMLTTTFPFS
jgi:hypothetical protein